MLSNKEKEKIHWLESEYRKLGIRVKTLEKTKKRLFISNLITSLTVFGLFCVMMYGAKLDLELDLELYEVIETMQHTDDVIIDALNKNGDTMYQIIKEIVRCEVEVVPEEIPEPPEPEINPLNELANQPPTFDQIL